MNFHAERDAATLAASAPRVNLLAPNPRARTREGRGANGAS